MCVPGNRTEDGLKRQVQLKTSFDLDLTCCSRRWWVAKQRVLDDFWRLCYFRVHGSCINNHGAMHQKSGKDVFTFVDVNM